MNRWKYVLASLILLAVPMMAQTLPTPTPIAFPQPTYTTAMVGFTASQTVQLNVLNISSVPVTVTGSTTPTPACAVELAFYDSQDRLILQSTVPNLAPRTSASLDLTRTLVPAASATTPRIELRGQVSTVTPTAGNSPIATFSSCLLFVSLETIDTATGVTQAYTSDTRAISSGGIMPMAAGIEPQ